MAPADDRLALLLRALREQASAGTPGWTDTNDSDPGVTLVNLLAYLAEQLESRAAELPASSRADVARLGLQLARLDPDDAPIRVHVDGEPWQAVSDFAAAAPDAAVFAVNDADGTIRFGDGVRGRRPADGSSVSATFRTGGGAAGAVSTTVVGRWPFDAEALRVGRRLPVGSASPVRDDDPFRPRQLERPNYVSGQLLTADDLALDQAYMREKFRRLQLASFDTGVIAGLLVTVDNSGDTPVIVVSPGSALDPQGELIVLDGEVSCPVPPLSGDGLVLLRYVERGSAFSLAGIASPGDGPALPRPSRITEGAAISIADTMDEGAVLLARLTRAGEGWSAAAPLAMPE